MRIAIACVSILGCSMSRDVPCAGKTVQLTATIDSLPQAEVVSDVTLHRTLDRPPYTTVYKLLVNGAAATSSSDDFVAFDVVLPLTLLQGGNVPTKPVEVALSAAAVTSCDQEPVPVDVDGSIAVAPQPPVILPSSGVIEPGDDVTALVEPHGEQITGCKAIATSGLSIFLNGADLQAGSFSGFDTPVILRINAGAIAASTPISVTISCEDALGRVATATFAST